MSANQQQLFSPNAALAYEQHPQDVGPCPRCDGRLHRLVCAPTRAVCGPLLRHNVDLESGDVFDLR